MKIPTCPKCGGTPQRQGRKTVYGTIEAPAVWYACPLCGYKTAAAMEGLDILGRYTSAQEAEAQALQNWIERAEPMRQRYKTFFKLTNIE